MIPPIRPKTAPIVPSINARGIAGIRVIVFVFSCVIKMHLRIQELVSIPAVISVWSIGNRWNEGEFLLSLSDLLNE
jgi:hypothetical protein